MRNFKYKVQSRSGATVSGVVEAYDQYDAVIKLKESYPLVLEVEEAGSKDINDIFGARKIKLKSLALMCEQFSIILSSGMALVRCVELVANKMTDKALQRILKEVADDVGSGSMLSSSFENRGPQLPVTFIETIRAGEESGNLDGAFAKLSSYYGKVAKTRQKVTSAMIYPVFIICVAVIVVIIIMVFAMPMFAQTFEQMGEELPLATKLLIGTSDFFRDNIIILIALAISLTLAVRIYAKTENGKVRLAQLKLTIPLFGKIAQMNSASQFANTMSTMVASGITLVNAVVITGRSMSNYIMGRDVQNAATQLESGRRLAESLGSSRYLPELLIEMIAVGEETGSLEGTLETIGNYYDNETASMTEKLMAIMEPAIIVFLAVLVFIILIAVYVPMFSMYNSV